MANMNESTNSQIRDLLDRSETVGIVVGKKPSLDAMGAALALYLSLQTSGKKVSVASATEPLVEHSNLVGIDKVRANFEGQGGDLIVSFPYREGEIDKVSYTLDDGALNIVVKPGELGLSFTEQDVVFRRKGEYPQLIFTIGVPKISDLSSIFGINELKDTMIINIDTKIDNQGFGDVIVIAPESSSISEQVAKLLTSLGLEIDLDVAQNLLSGIASATDNFQSPKTTPAAFEMAGILMSKGAVRQSVIRPQEREFPPVGGPGSQGQVLQQLTQQQRQQVQPASQRGEQPRRDQRGTRLGSARQENFPPRRDQNQGQPIGSEAQVQRGQPSASFDSPSAPFGSSSTALTAGAQDKSSGQSGLNPKNPPEDWLTPKVYKGSTNV